MNGYIVTILGGVWLTLGVALGALALATAIGLAVAAARLSALRFLARAATVYTTLIRGVPDLVLMLLIFYGGQNGLNRVAAALGYDGNLDISPFAAGVVTLGVIYGAYLAETFRGAIMAIPRGQAEAGLAFGMSRWQVQWRIVLPQMVRLAIPGFTNNWLVLIKATALISVIGLTDVMYLAKQASGATRSAFIYFAVAGVVYLAITSVSLALLALLERRFSRGVRLAAH